MYCRGQETNWPSKVVRVTVYTISRRFFGPDGEERLALSQALSTTVLRVRIPRNGASEGVKTRRLANRKNHTKLR